MTSVATAPGGRVEPGPEAEVLPGGIPASPPDPAWCLVVDSDPEDPLGRVAESLLALADGSVGTRGALEEAAPVAADPVVLAAGVYEPAEGGGERLLALPSWCSFPLREHLPPGRRTLDLRDGLLVREVPPLDGAATMALRSVRFASVARSGCGVLVAETAAAPTDVQPLDAWRRRSPAGGGVAAAVSTETRTGAGDQVTLVRRAAHVVGRRAVPAAGVAARRLEELAGHDVLTLVGEQRRVWERRWAEADVEVVGDVEVTRGLRFAVFHLLGAARATGESAVGARGLTGSAYAGHVFWDTDVFVTPVLAAIDAPRARSTLEYRVRRLPAARRRAAAEGRAGARFPWESAGSGDDVTPREGVDPRGETVSITTGDLEEHITADVAWAAWRYASWTGDWGFLTGRGRGLLTDTARYWAARARWDSQGRAHLEGVTGPDEYHEGVDDNAYTNVMARWNLQRAAELVRRRLPGAAAGTHTVTDTTTRADVEEADGEDEEQESRRWLATAAALVDNVDPVSGIVEQFAGYHRLAPVLAAELGTPPLAADLILGAERLRRTQLIKQADVLMAFLTVPASLPAGALAANVGHYLPRTVHGSSLSPAVHAACLARVGRAVEAAELLRLALAIDLEDLTETTAGGLHLANLGGVWQAVVHGFAGVALSGPDDDTFVLDPALPPEWRELRFRVRWHGRRLAVRCRAERAWVGTDRPLTVRWHGAPVRVRPPGRWVP